MIAVIQRVSGARSSQRLALRTEPAALIEQRRVQLEHPLASARPATASRVRRAA